VAGLLSHKLASITSLGQGPDLLRGISTTAREQLIPVNLMSIEHGPIHAGELGGSVHTHPAGAAHAGAVNHDRIECGQGGHIHFAGDLRHDSHHEGATDYHKLIDLFAPVFNQFDEHFLYTAPGAAAAVLGRHDHLIADFSQFIVVPDKKITARLDHADHLVAGFLESARDRVDSANPVATAAQNHGADLFGLMR